MTFKLGLDVLVAALLVATIVYAVILNRRLGALRTGRDDLAKMIRDFAAATERAEASIAKLKTNSGRRQSDLEERIEGARAIREELAFLIDRADSQSNRLEGLIRSGRQDEHGAETTSPSKSAPSMSAGAGAGRSAAEQELLQTLQSLR